MKTIYCPRISVIPFELQSLRFLPYLSLDQVEIRGHYIVFSRCLLALVHGTSVAQEREKPYTVPGIQTRRFLVLEFSHFPKSSLYELQQGQTCFMQILLLLNPD